MEQGAEILRQQINKYVTDNLCLDETDSSTLYLEAAMKESYKVLSNIDSAPKKIFSGVTADIPKSSQR
jgi:hypothetical protein